MFYDELVEFEGIRRHVADHTALIYNIGYVNDKQVASCIFVAPDRAPDRRLKDIETDKLRKACPKIGARIFMPKCYSVWQVINVGPLGLQARVQLDTRSDSCKCKICLHMKEGDMKNYWVEK